MYSAFHQVFLASLLDRRVQTIALASLGATNSCPCYAIGLSVVGGSKRPKFIHSLKDSSVIGSDISSF